MSIKLPFVPMVSGVVVSASRGGEWVQGEGQAAGPKRRAALTTITNDLGQPLEATTAADGGFSLNIKDGSTIKQLLTLATRCFSRVQKTTSQAHKAEGLSCSTPLHLDAQKSVTVTPVLPSKTGC